MSKKSFNFKSFTSFLVSWTFVIMVLSGTMLWVSPPGRVAHWTGWSLLGGSKAQWESIHILMAIVFLIAGLFHLLKFNWSVFTAYLKRKSGSKSYREVTVSLVLFGLVLGGTLLEIPPMTTVMELTENIKNSWEPESNEAPVPHMELQTLKQVALRFEVTGEDALQTLSKDGLSIEGPDQILQEIGKVNNLSPREIYLKLEAAYGAPKVAEAHGGVPLVGVGRMTVEQVARELGMSTEAVVAKLETPEVSIDSKEMMRDVASRLDVSPPELLEKLREN